MNHRYDDGRRFLTFILIVAAVISVWHCIRQTVGTGQALDETLAGQQEFNVRMSTVDRARQVTEMISTSQPSLQEPG